MCPGNNGPLCTTCRLGGLIRCPILGVPLPLVDGERTAVKRKPVRVWYAGSGDLTEDERRRIYQWLRDQGVFE